MFGVNLQDIKDAREFIKLIYKTRYYFASLYARYILLIKLRKVYEFPELITFLKNRYSSYDLLSIDNQYFPTVLFPYFQEININEPCPIFRNENLDKDWSPNNGSKIREFYYLMRSEIGNYNHDTFILKCISNNGSIPKVNCGISDFFSNLLSSAGLEWELLKGLRKNKYKPSTKQRDRIHNIANNPIIDGNGRINGIGISTLIIFKNNNQYSCILKRRGRLSMFLRIGMFHVLPSGMFQAPFHEYDTEFSAIHNILWEYYEEFFSIPDPKIKNENSKWFYSKPEVKELKDMLSNDKAKLYFTGISVDLTNLRPEFLFLIVIHDKNWYQNHNEGNNEKTIFKFNREHATSDSLKTGENPILKINCELSVNKIFEENNLTCSNLAPCSSATLKRGIEVFNSLKKSA